MKLKCENCILGAPMNICFEITCNNYKKHQSIHEQWIKLLLSLIGETNEA